MTDISVVIPVFRASSSLSELHHRLVSQFETLKLKFEIIFIEDCGGDDSWIIIQSLAQNDHRVCGIRFSRNYGQHNALLAGIRAANGQLIVTMDDDLQHPPEEIPRLLSKIYEGCDVVYGAPDKGQRGFFRDIASQITKIALQKSMGAETASNVSSFRVFRTELRDAFESYKSPSVNIDVLLTWGTTKFLATPVRQEERKYGNSNYSTRKLIRHAIDMMTGFTTVPLKIAGIIGFIFAIFGVLIFFYVLVQYFVNGSVVPGFAFLASIIAIFSGSQLLALGIIGEYISRIHQRSMERPAYLVKEFCSKRD